MIVQVAVGLCVLPLAASALLRGSDAAAPDSAGAMLTVGGALVAGWKTSGIGWLRGDRHGDLHRPGGVRGLGP